MSDAEHDRRGAARLFFFFEHQNLSPATDVVGQPNLIIWEGKKPLTRFFSDEALLPTALTKIHTVASPLCFRMWRRTAAPPSWRCAPRAVKGQTMRIHQEFDGALVRQVGTGGRSVNCFCSAMLRPLLPL